VFLPSDVWFRRLVADLAGTWPRGEAATVDAVAALAAADEKISWTGGFGVVR
jgi:hypothetical protein